MAPQAEAEFIMTPSEITLIILGILIITALILTNTAIRLDRLHRRLDSVKYTLEAELRERAAAAHELVTSGAVEVESMMVAQGIAWRNLTKLPPLVWADQASLDARADQEYELCTVLHAVLGDRADQEELLKRAPSEYRNLARAHHRAQLALVFYNDAVDTVLRLRHLWLVRVFHLAGRTPLPIHMHVAESELSLIEVNS